VGFRSGSDGLLESHANSSQKYWYGQRGWPSLRNPATPVLVIPANGTVGGLCTPLVGQLGYVGADDEDCSETNVETMKDYLRQVRAMMVADGSRVLQA
jgi:hypothetical protein